jgi:hypothetical protein
VRLASDYPGDVTHSNAESGSVVLAEEDQLRAVGLWTAASAERVLALFEARVGADSRPREAIEGICEFGLGGPRVVRLRSLAWAAHAAAGEAIRFARGCSSCRVDGGVCLYASLGAFARQTKQALGAAVYAARARKAATGDSGVGDQEIGWAIEHASPTVRALVQRMPSPRSYSVGQAL